MTVDNEVSVLRAIENVETSRNRTCLFGRPDAGAADEMLKEQFESDRRRFIEKWGFDVLHGEPFKKPRDKRARRASKDVDAPDAPKKGSDRSRRNKENRHPDRASPKKTLKMSGDRSYSKNARQSQMTDYWNYRKLSESSCSDKEN